eukprot:280978-Pyramimonas_sp.AAC.1
MHGFGARSPNPWIGGGALPKMRPVPPRSAASLGGGNPRFPMETGPVANPRPLDPCLRSPEWRLVVLLPRFEAR